MTTELQNKQKFNIKNIITMENLLCFFIVICPLLDAFSFLFRRYFNTSISISTFIRPIIPLIAIIYIFFKYKLKPQLLLAALVYGVYAICHLYVFYKIKPGCSYGNEIRELQYLINYTYMAMNLFIYYYFFARRNRDKEAENELRKGKIISKLKKSVLIALTIYIALMYLAIITGTSSFTYEEDQMGLKGWFESGNSIGTIMLLCLFIVIPMMSKKNSTGIRIWSLMVIMLTGVYLATLLGTRTGLLGIIIVICAYVVINIAHSIIYSKNINKKLVAFGSIVFVIILIAVTIFGSKTIERRKLLKDRQNLIYDQITGAPAHVTGDLVNIVEQIKNGTLSKDYMPEEMQKTILELYDEANQKEISSTDMRTIQLIYHSHLIKNEKGISIALFGNGYMSHFYELIFEMEVPAFLYNFGIVGFFLYCMPFIFIAIYGAYVLYKKVKNTSVEYAMYLMGLIFAIIISFVSGYTFFNSSSMMIIIVLTTLVINEIKDMEDAEMKIYERK